MKTNFPRHANVPADFIYIGKGGAFKPAYRDAYYYVTKDGFCEALNFHCEKSDYADSEGADFYVKKNGPTHLLNKPKKNMYTLTKTQQNYYGIKEIEIPAGYRAVKTGEIGGENCRFLMCHSFVFGDKLNHTYKASDFTLVIAPIKKKPVIKDAIPGLVWPAVVKKDGAAKDLIYVGQGKEGGIVGLNAKSSFAFDTKEGVFNNNWSYDGNCLYYHYFVPKDHPILAKYNLNPTRETTRETKAELKKENESLKDENASLKARLLKFEKIVKEASAI